MSDPLALLMSDLVDSTGITQRLGAAAAQRLWAEHDRLARALLADWGGIEVDKSDGFLMIFEDAASASRYAQAYHRALTALPECVRARVGIHVAPVDVRPNSAPEVEQGAKPFEIDNWMAKALTSRLMSLARGGQTLVSPAGAATLAGTALVVRSHGCWRLQGVADPVEVFEVGDATTDFQPPADVAKAWRVVERNGVWLPMREVRHSLPSEPDPFIGRTKDLLALTDALQSQGTRLCSILGTGGIGKTRLALRLGWQQLGDHAGGVWFCDLSTAQGLDGLLFAVAQGLQMALDQTDPVAQVGQTVAARGPCLVIFDNFDRLTAWAGATVGRWMQAAPQAHFIVTSRQVLSIAGERTFPVAPLTVTDGVDLFERRAREAAPDRTGSGSADGTVEELVRLLDGLPLAIELAAARVRVMTPRHMVERMGQRFRLLASPGGRPVQRQSTLRAALDWSWELLSTAERRALAQLSVFEGSFTLADAEAVLDPGDDPDPPWVPDLLQSLVEKSMLRISGSERFDLLRSMQDYAAEHLATPGRFPDSGAEGLAQAQQRHWRHFGQLQTRPDLASSPESVDNFVVACRRALAASDAASAAGALLGAWTSLRRNGPYQVILDLFDQVSSLQAIPADQRSAIECAAGQAYELLGQGELARARLDAALRLATEAGDVDAEGWARVALAEHLYKRGQADAAREMLARVHELQPASLALRCAALNAMGNLEMRLGRAGEARAAYEAALQLAQACGDKLRAGGILGNLAILMHDAGDTQAALRLYEDALARTLLGHDRRWEGNTRCNLGLLLQEVGRDAEAEAQFSAALVIARDIGHAMLEATVQCNLGILLEARGALPLARDHHQQAVDLARRAGDKRATGQFNGYLGEVLARLGHVDEGMTCMAEGEAALREAGDDTSLSMLLCQRALVDYLAGRQDEAQGKLVALQMSAESNQTGELSRGIDRARRLMTRT